MEQLTSLQKKSLMDKSGLYRENIEEHPLALAYLEGRGLTRETIGRFGLGFVSREVAFPDDLKFINHISIPYLAYSPTGGYSVLSIRYRALDPEHEPKYNTYSGIRGQRVLFNPGALTRDNDYIAICEGEIDTISAEQAGVSAVGVNGATKWKNSPWLRRLFRGYRKVFVLYDGDEAGYNLQKVIASDIPTAVPVRLDTDVNDLLVREGENAIKWLIGIT